MNVREEHAEECACSFERNEEEGAYEFHGLLIALLDAEDAQPTRTHRGSRSRLRLRLREQHSSVTSRLINT